MIKNKVKNQISTEIFFKDTYYVESVVSEYYKKKDAAGYLCMTEDAFDQFIKAVNVKHAVLFPDGEPIYSIDELDKWAINADQNLFDIEAEENNKTE